jgi:hypothetical protein
MKFALAMIGAAAVWMTAGCGGRTYASEAEYLSQRQRELMAEAPATMGLEKDGAKWYLWKTGSGHGRIDVVVVSGTASVARTIPFDAPRPALSLGAATEYIELEKARGQKSATQTSAWRSARQTELLATSGKFAGFADGGHFMVWTTPTGFLLDEATGDGHGGLTAKPAAELTPYPSEGAAIADGQKEDKNLAEWEANRARELGGATLDWGRGAGGWLLAGWKLPNGSYKLDAIEADPLRGYVLAKSWDHATLDELAFAADQQVLTPEALWSSGLQYSKNGYLLVITMLLVGVFVVGNIVRARGATGLTIRRIAGLDQIDEAIGRATETARPVLMVPGIGVLDGISVQALTIFGSVIRSAARFGTPIRLLTAHPAVFGVAQEIARDVYLSEGVPEQFDADSVRFVSDRQFAFASGVAGVIQRERVAAAFFMGEFFAESLIFAENANLVGAIQVASSTQTTQTPFFIAACDYVLLGDEFYAASAYLGRQEVLLGSLIGVDWAKMAFMGFIALGVLVHSVETMKPVDAAKLPVEMREKMASNRQVYPDWRNETFFVKVTNEKRL